MDRSEDLDAEGALLHCWAEQRDDLLRFCRRSLGRADGEEAFSRATLSMLRAAVAMGAVRRPAAWLQLLVHRACVDVHRERARRERLLLLTHRGDDLVELAIPHHAVCDPEQTILDREALVRLESAIRALPHALRAPFLLRVEDELSYADMAARLFESEESLRKRVQIARRLLRRSALSDETNTSAAPDETPLPEHAA
ncbi:RNA polymerase, sigma-24 subunit, ECF subfamily protein [Minicystis rosea]|nr:RNA polymerase, sigma-24 subunit, ECF subfamily protein [Minicystis rosea]